MHIYVTGKEMIWLSFGAISLWSTSKNRELVEPHLHLKTCGSSFDLLLSLRHLFLLKHSQTAVWAHCRLAMLICKPPENRQCDFITSKATLFFITSRGAGVFCLFFFFNNKSYSQKAQQPINNNADL